MRPMALLEAAGADAVGHRELTCRRCQELTHFSQQWREASVEAHGKDSSAVRSRGEDGLQLLARERWRLLAENVLPCLERLNRKIGVRCVTGCDDYGIDVLVGDHGSWGGGYPGESQLAACSLGRWARAPADDLELCTGSDECRDEHSRCEASGADQ